MEDNNVKTINTIFILMKHCNSKILDENDKKVLVDSRKRLDRLLYTGVAFAGLSTYVYNRLAKRFISKGFIRKSSDIAFVLLFTSITSYTHNRMIQGINLDSIRRKYRYILKNSVLMGNIDANEDFISRIHRFNNKHLYLIVFLTFRIIF